jgi:hypothetical protein
MTALRKDAVSLYRHRMKQQGMVRLEVQVRKDDAPLLRDVAIALADPTQGSKLRALLQERFGMAKPVSLKALLASAPLEGIDLTRDLDHDRHIDL